VKAGDEQLLLRAPGQLRLAAGSAVRVGWDPTAAHFFEAASGRRVDADQLLQRAA